MSTTNKTKTINYRTVIYIALLICFPFNLLGSKNDSTSLSFRLNTSPYFEKGILTEIKWDSIRKNDEIAPNIIRKTTIEYKYAFHPFWMGTSYSEDHYFDNVDRIGYFAYILKPFKTSTFPSYSWKNTSLLYEAKRNNCKVDLVVYCPTTKDLDILLKNDTLQDSCINEILDLAQYKHVADKDTIYADGINLFVDTLNQNQREAFILFISKLKLAISNKDIKLVLSLSLLDSKWYNKEVKDSVYLIIPKDFDYYGNLIIPNKFILWFIRDTFAGETPTKDLYDKFKDSSQILFLLSILCLILIVLYLYVCVIHNLAYNFRNLFLIFIGLLLIVDFGYFICTIDLQVTINLDLCLIVVDLIIGFLLIRQLILNNAKLP